ncbi:MAG: hypothetical protein HY264_06895, partial [Chloroflexi bacterium]|nr:hypothetical protein [Chloroflexota bacterium]
IVGPATIAVVGGRILNTHPSLLPAFPGGHAVRDALAHGVAVTGCTIHLVDATLDGGPIVAQEAVPILATDDEAALHERIRAVEHRLLPRAVADLAAGALHLDGRRLTLDAARAADVVPVPRRALLSVSDKTGLADVGRGLVTLGFELVSTGGTARALRDAGLPVTDVAAVTGVPEMLDGRVKTLHPRIHAGILVDRRLAAHREALAAAAIAPFEVVVVNLYPFAAAADRPGISLDELVEEIDIGGPSMVRAAAKNHASVAIVTSPDRYGEVLDEFDRVAPAPLPEGLRAALAVEAFRHTAAYDARIAAELPVRMASAGVDLPDSPGLPGATDPYPPKHTNACGAAERATLLAAWEAALAGDPVSAFGGVVALTGEVDRAVAERLASIFLEVVVAPGFDGGALEVLAARPNLRLLRDTTLGSDVPPPPPSPRASLRTAGGAVLVTAPDALPDEPVSWTVATRRRPSAAERADLDLAWRLARGVSSNAIVLVRDGALIGMGSGQVSRVDAARQAVEKARRFAGVEALGGASCGSDAFFPFPDAVETCLEAGVTAFVQPGGSIRDADVIAAADAASATMLVTGVRHFRH